MVAGFPLDGTARQQGDPRYQKTPASPQVACVADRVPGVKNRDAEVSIRTTEFRGEHREGLSPRLGAKRGFLWD